MDIKSIFDKHPEMILLSRAWLIDHGWQKAENYLLFKDDGETISSDLCVVLNRKEYMIARFHHMGEKAFNPEMRPSSIEVVGVNNIVEMDDPSHSCLLLAVIICGIGCFEEIQKAIGGIYEIQVKHKKQTEL